MIEGEILAGSEAIILRGGRGTGRVTKKGKSFCEVQTIS